MRATYFKPCPLCGANLDPGERCNCAQRKEIKAKSTRQQPRMRKSVRAGAFAQRPSVADPRKKG